MNDEQLFLANAYVDGELTDDERRVAEADPAVMAEVAELRAIIADLRSTPPPAADARERAIAAALAEFDRNGVEPVDSATTVATSSPAQTSSDDSSRVGAGRWLSIAAGVLAIGVLGVVVVNGFGTSSIDSSSEMVANDAAPAAIENSLARAETASSAAEEEAMADTADSIETAATELLDDEAGDDGATSSADDAPADDGTASDESADEDAAEFLTEDAATASSSPVVDDPAAPFATPGELDQIGAILVERRDDRTLGPTPEYACNAVDPIDDAALEVLAYGTFDDGVSSREVLIGVIERDGDIDTFALDPDTCDVVLTDDPG